MATHGFSCHGAVRCILAEKICVCKSHIGELGLVVLGLIKELTITWVQLIIVL